MPSCASWESLAPTVMVPTAALYAMCCPPTAIAPGVVTSVGGAFSGALSDFAAAFSSSSARSAAPHSREATANVEASRRTEKRIRQSPESYVGGSGEETRVQISIGMRSAPEVVAGGHSSQEV